MLHHRQAMKNPSKMKTNNRRWEGYTLEELRCQRALVNARMMIAQNTLSGDVERVRETFACRSKTSHNTMLGRMIGALSYMDWIMLGVGLYRRLSPLLRRRN